MSKPINLDTVFGAYNEQILEKLRSGVRHDHIVTWLTKSGFNWEGQNTESSRASLICRFAIHKGLRRIHRLKRADRDKGSENPRELLRLVKIVAHSTVSDGAKIRSIKQLLSSVDAEG